MRRHHILIPLAALLAILPLLVHGCSCGHDLDFHLQSWLDAARQLRHGTYPHWAFSAAWSAGEPRFVFYPPLSWLLGALLSMLLPITAAPAIYTFLCLTAAGFAMHRLASHFSSSNAALLAAILYLANPYMLFNAFERTAYAELLAAAWVPLLLLGVLRARPTIPAIAAPIALLWLTNAPAAVMGCYTFALLALIRVVSAIPEPRRHPEAPSTLTLIKTYCGGAALGLALPAFYLVPAAYERRYVQIAMAVIANMRFQDNFLFERTADEPHNVVLHTVSLLAVVMVALTLMATITLCLRHTKLKAGSRQRIPEGPATFSPSPHTALLTLTLLIAFLLVPISTPIWNHLPNLAFLQFPWRLLTILSAVLTFTLALLLRGRPGAPFMSRLYRGMSGRPLQLAAPLCALALALLCIHLYRQPCVEGDGPGADAQLFATHHGVLPTDEYTPIDADNDVLRSDDPGYWLADSPAAFAPNTLANPDIANPGFDGDIPTEDTISATPPLRFAVIASHAEYLILNLRDYPNWQVKLTGNDATVTEPEHASRDDGLIAVPIPRGTDNVDIVWHNPPDQRLGFAISLIACILLAFLLRHSRKLTTE